MKVELMYIGNHQPKNMTVEVDEDKVAELLSTREYIRSDEKDSSIIEELEEVPDMTWTEMEIYNWIKDKNIPIKYKPVSDTKSGVLNKLKKGKYI